MEYCYVFHFCITRQAMFYLEFSEIRINVKVIHFTGKIIWCDAYTMFFYPAVSKENIFYKQSLDADQPNDIFVQRL